MRFDKSLDYERNKKEMKELMDKTFDLFKRFPFVVVAAIVVFSREEPCES